MPVVVCPKCRKSLSADPARAGEYVGCPFCHAKVPVPMELPDEAPAPAPAPRPRAPKDPFDFGPPLGEAPADEPAPRRRRKRDDDDDDEDEEDNRPRYRRGQQEGPPKWLMGVAMIPLALAIVGGLIGGLCGGVAAIINGAVAKQRGMSVAVKLAIFAATTVIAIIAYVVIVAALLKALNEEERQPRRRAEVVPLVAPAPLKGATDT